MKKTNNEKGGAPDVSNAKQENRPDITSLPKMEVYAVLGLELSKQILERIEKVEDTVDILARQKKRELDPDQSETDTIS